MKITKRQLRRIIKETISEVRNQRFDSEGYEMTSQAAMDKKIYDAIIDLLPMRAGGMLESELIDSVNQLHPEIDAEDILDFVEELEGDGVVAYDPDLEEWSLRTR